MPTDPVQLYRTLVKGRGAPAGLWTHQADILTAWHTGYMASRDVALELPTGAGKTLVGGLAAEFRRRTAGERIAYVCPTRQLARQVQLKFATYGVPAVLLTGRAAGFNAADRAKYTAAQAVAVTVYSHLFNSNSAFSDAQYLILDDAHAAEGAVASAWSIEIPRDSNAYLDILSVISGSLDGIVVERLRTDSPDGAYQTSVYLASPLGIAQVAAELERTLDSAVQSGALDSSVRYGMRLLRGHLSHCMVYAAYGRMLIRPFIAPTATLTAFENASQRLYMSATLGAGGELERSFGRRRIDRIPVPDGWERQGTGRRFFFFPELTSDLSRSSTDTDEWIQDRLRDAGRSVVITPDRRGKTRFESSRLPTSVQIVEAPVIEDDLEPFIGQDAAALMLTNRYDGVDLPDDDCRLVVLQGLPARGDLQERFLHESLGALEVLQERIRARVVQGAGRATRNSGDFAAVMVLGNDLASFLTRGDVQAAMHPEVHAELSFGLDYSLDLSSGEMLENLAAFLAQNEDWRAVEAEITARRDSYSPADAAGAVELARSASHEVEACLASWQGEMPRAVESARRAIDALRGGRAPQRYAAFWNYLAACWTAQLAASSDDASWSQASESYFRAARAAGRGTTWLSHLASPADDAAARRDEEQTDPLDVAAARQVLSRLDTLGRPARFDADVSAMRAALLGTEPRPYEDALVQLGLYAGASDSTGNGGADAAPDAAWLFEDLLWVAWEAKSNASTQSELSADYVRQAGGHLRYVGGNLGTSIPSGSPALIVTPQERVHSAAVAVAEESVHVVRPTEVVNLLDRIIRSWRGIRTVGGQGVASEQNVVDCLRREGALPSQWLSDLTAYQLRQEIQQP